MSEEGIGRSEYQVQDITCPVCQEDAKLISHLLDIPYYIDFLMINVNCNSCGYRRTDFMNTQAKEPTRFSYPVETKVDQTTKVVRATESTVYIPELGITIEPVGDGTSWIRNIEGILEDIKEKLYTTLKQTEDQETKQAVKQRLKMLKKLRLSESPFTVIIEDPNGNSLILPADENKLQKEIYDPES